ncbi:hypothetical protein [Brevibacillus parabrevis]
MSVQAIVNANQLDTTKYLYVAKN